MKSSFHYRVEQEFPRNTVSFIRNIFQKVKFLVTTEGQPMNCLLVHGSNSRRIFLNSNLTQHLVMPDN